MYVEPTSVRFVCI